MNLRRFLPVIALIFMLSVLICPVSKAATPKPQGEKDSITEAISNEIADQFDFTGLDEDVKTLNDSIFKIIESVGVIIMLFGLYKFCQAMSTYEPKEYMASASIIFVGMIIANLQVIHHAVMDSAEEGTDLIDAVNELLFNVMFWIGIIAIIVSIVLLVTALPEGSVAKYTRASVVFLTGVCLCAAKLTIKYIRGGFWNYETGGPKKDAADFINTAGQNSIKLVTDILFWAGIGGIVASLVSFAVITAGGKTHNYHTAAIAFISGVLLMGARAFIYTAVGV